MFEIVLGIGHAGASNTPHTTIKTYALGSCVAVILLCPESKGVGMAHIALANASINPGKAAELPGYFADTALPFLLEKMALLNNGKRNTRLYAKIAGGGSLIGCGDIFNIGLRNVLQVKKLLAEAGIPLASEDTGGVISRTVTAEINTGKVEIYTPGRAQWKI
jgi:chemotaxis protein CheD